MTKIPENSDTTEPPDELQETAYTCTHEGCGKQFATAEAYTDHAIQCPHNPIHRGGDTEE